MTTLHLTTGLACFLALPMACSWDEPVEGSFRDAQDETGGDENEAWAEAEAEASAEAAANGKGRIKLCGNGKLNIGEQCDHGSFNANDSACTSSCQLGFCGDGLVHAGLEECDDGGTVSGDGCSDTCELEPPLCSWTGASFPVNVWSGQAVLGEIAFDGNCDLIVGGGEELPYVEALYRVSKNDGSVSVLVPVADLPADSLVVSGITHRASDDRIYFAVNIADAPQDMLYAVDAADDLHPVLGLENFIHSLTVAPASFGSHGDQLIGVAGKDLLAIDVDNGIITPIASSTSFVSVATFASDGTLFVAEWGNDRISTVAPDGTFTTFYAGLDAPDGLAIRPDGTGLVVSYLQGWQGHIDQISIPGGVLTSGVEFELSTGAFPTGLVVGGDNQVLYEMPLNNFAAIGAFAAP